MINYIKNEINKSGFSIIPVLGNKKPAFGWKEYQTTPATSEEIDRWENEYKAFAIVTGKVSDCFVLDFDGEEGIKTLEMLGIKPHVKTPSGGYHAYFNYPQCVKKITTVNKSKDSLYEKYPSLDTRGDGGYAIFYGSTDKGDYQHLKEFSRENFYDIDILPQDLQDILICKNVLKSNSDNYATCSLKTTATSTNEFTPAQPKIERIPVERILERLGDYKQYGGRNPAMFHFGCQLRDNNYEKREIFVIVSEYARTLPNINMHGEHEPLTTAEISSTIESVFSREQREAWSLSNPASKEDFLLNERCTDTGNKLVFIEKHKDNLKCALSLKSAEWFIWNGKAWAEDSLQTINDMVENEVRSWYADVALIGDDITKEGRAKKVKFARHIDKSLSKSSRDNLISLSTTSTEVSCTKSDFDQNDYLLNCQNGTLNLKTKELCPHKKEDLITKILQVDYTPSAECPLFMKFLNEVFCNDSELIFYIQKVFGYCLTGDMKEEKIWIFAGAGSNGKSTLLEAIQDVMGDYATPQPADSLSLDKFGNSGRASNDVTLLEGKRLAIASETQEGLRFNEQKLKNLTEAFIVARNLYQDYRKIRLTHKTVLVCNHMPTIKGQDNGIWRRLVAVPFNQRFDKPGVEGTLPIDISLKKKLKKEYSGIFRWMVEGYYKYAAESLGSCKAVEETTADYKNEMDTIGTFIAERCNILPSLSTSSTDIYKAYTNWCSVNGNNYMLSQINFSKQLTDKGFANKHTSRGTVWLGIGVGITIETRYPKFDEELYRRN